MPTSAAGNSGTGAPRRNRFPRRHTRPACGFTLLELIVVIAIIAMATAAVSFAIRDTSAAKLDREADRLAALLESARAQSRASGIVVRWRPVEGSFVFDGLPPGALPSGWAAEGITAQAALSNGTPVPALQLGPDPIIAAQQVMLHSAGPPARALRIATDGVRPFTVSAVQ
ncbi:prepilin-type N-terminal cleavage/methylation domain-containing protein [Variovorax sp. CF313]|mgnify:CR=1 FL=1|jgi:general secretion pathway protein H|uniref:prepilin-type N-terminal cleavage/methylation domain-containing protein n=1 Tax=unclassified Variovorax TaxID=663243 RepID=UPI0002712F4E|nr:prepilin-type N-terminal cleavage/methylation domain-containing protein [Variovorax sp. CF313]EJL74005.1 general secretion pathway protein H [Variovorax sp. CF313]